MKSHCLSRIQIVLIMLTGTGILLTGSRGPGKTETLESRLNNLVQNFHGQAGIYVYAPERKVELGIHADSLFPTASMIKVTILCTLWNEVGHGKLNPDSVVHFYADSVSYPYPAEDDLARFTPGATISVRHLMTNMITFSDNHASLYLQQLAGGGKVINQWLEENGFQYTRVNSRTPGREAEQQKYGWGQTTPREMTRLLWFIRQGKVVDPEISEAVYRHLIRIYWNGVALSQIPPTVQVASKQGALDASKSEVLLVNAPHGDYAFCVITKNQQDTSWTRNNEGDILIRKVSALLWNYFEPRLPYTPVEITKKYYP